MTADDDVDCQVPSVGILPWFFFPEIGFLALKLKTNASVGKVGFFFHPCH